MNQAKRHLRPYAKKVLSELNRLPEGLPIWLMHQGTIDQLAQKPPLIEIITKAAKDRVEITEAGRQWLADEVLLDPGGWLMRAATGVGPPMPAAKAASRKTCEGKVMTDRSMRLGGYMLIAFTEHQLEALLRRLGDLPKIEGMAIGNQKRKESEQTAIETLREAWGLVLKARFGPNNPMPVYRLKAKAE